MRLFSLKPLLLLAPAVFASMDKRQAAANTPSLQDEAASLVSVYVPPTVYAQLTASVAAAAAAASVTGDPGSLFLSAILATTPPAWFGSAVPAYFSSNIAALESAVSTLRIEATATTTSSSETLVVTQTTNSLGSTVATSYTSTLPVTTTSHSSSSSSAAAAPTAGAQQQAGLGIAALALGLAAIL